MISLGNPRLAVILVIVNIPLYALIWRAFFGDWDDFKETVYFWFSPHLLNWLRGKTLEESWAKLKVLVFLGCNALLVISEY